MQTCENANGTASDSSIRCAALKGQKWDFCIHQYFCRDKGKYVLSDSAAQCKNRKAMK
jgi:hypothetical protein